jgi:hypothetical protein
MTIWGDALTKISNLAESFVIMKDVQKTQAQEIALLRQDNAELRRENAKITERLATLEEGRKTIAAEVKRALTVTLALWQIEQKDKEIARLKNE